MSYTRNLFFNDLSVLDENGVSLNNICYDISMYMYITVLENQVDFLNLLASERCVLHDGCITSIEAIYFSNMQSNPIKIGKRYTLYCYSESKSNSTSFDVIFLQTEITKKIDSRTNQYFLSGVKINPAYDRMGIFKNNKIHFILEYCPADRQMKIHKLSSKEDFTKFSKEYGAKSIVYKLNDWLESQHENFSVLPTIGLDELENYFI